MRVVVESNKLKAVYSCTAPKWGFDQCSSKRLFLCLSRNRLAVGDPYGRARGYALLWVRSERARRAAKIAPLTEWLSGMCGSVRVCRRLVPSVGEG